MVAAVELSFVLLHRCTLTITLNFAREREALWTMVDAEVILRYRNQKDTNEDDEADGNCRGKVAIVKVLL